MASGGAALKVEVDAESCCLCGTASEELYLPDEQDAVAPMHQPPLRAMLLHLNHSKTIPSGKLCNGCIQKTIEAYNFSMSLAFPLKDPPPLSEKIRTLRKRLHELTQKIDVFIVVGGGSANGAYNEEDIIMVDRDAVAAASQADETEIFRTRNLKGENVYQCTVCPLTFECNSKTASPILMKLKWEHTGAPPAQIKKVSSKSVHPVERSERLGEFQSHTGTHSAQSIHSCWTCGAQFASSEAAASHRASHGDHSEPHCYLCVETFPSLAALRRHEALGACPTTCPARACGYEADSIRALREHAARCERAALCARCFRAFPSAALLHAHAPVHLHARHFLCGYDGCILRFATRSGLVAHIRKCHAELPAPPAVGDQDQHQDKDHQQPVPCPHCTRTFATAPAMKRHARVHKTENKVNRQEQMEWTEGEELCGKVEYLEVEALEDIDDMM